MRILVGATICAAVLGGSAAALIAPGTPAAAAATSAVAEGGKVKVKVTLPVAEETAKVRWRLKAGGADFVKSKGSVTQREGTRKVTITLRTRQDTLLEGTETFKLRVGGRRVDVTVTDDDSRTPALSAVDLSRSESSFGFPQVRLDAPAPVPVWVTWATAPGTATAGVDYAQASGTVVIAPGETSVAMPVGIADDADHEQAETFDLVLSNPSGASIADARSTVTIVNDDPQPAISIADGPDRIENATTMPFTVTLDRRSWQPVTVNAGTAAGTAGGGNLCSTPGTDFLWLNNLTVTFAPGETSKQVSVAICEDALDEQTETFTVLLSNPDGATLEDDDALGRILDDD